MGQCAPEDSISQCPFLQMIDTAGNPHADGSAAPGARPRHRQSRHRDPPDTSSSHDNWMAARQTSCRQQTAPPQPRCSKDVTIHLVSCRIHAIILTVFNLASTSPRFHHPFCLQARLPPSTLSSGASFSVSSSVLADLCSFFFLFTFPWKTAFPSCSNPLSLQSPFAGRINTRTTSHSTPHHPIVRIALSHSSRPPSSRLSHRKTVGPCFLPQNFVVLEQVVRLVLLRWQSSGYEVRSGVCVYYYRTYYKAV